MTSSVFLSAFDPNMQEVEQLNRFQRLLVQELGPTTKPEDLRKLKDRRLRDNDQFNVAAVLHGPLYQTPDEMSRYIDVTLEMGNAATMGWRHIMWQKYQDDAAAQDEAYAKDPRAVNIVVPQIQVSDSEEPFLSFNVILSDPDDCARIARSHLQKQPNFTPIFFQSLIATTDNTHWARQRSHLIEVFLPKLSLAQIFPSSWARAKHCARRLELLRQRAGEHGVQMHDFFLHEAQAQLQLALFGMDEEFMDATNEKIRNVFAGTCDDLEFGKDMCLNMLKKVGQDSRFCTASDEEAARGEKPIFGPLSKSVAKAGEELNLSLKDQFGNMMLILFAGHDTTAHTMTWLAYELAKHPEYQRRLDDEVDALFAQLQGRDMTYEDCDKLPFLTRCAMETLRLWPAVGNGTFRRLQFDDTVKGPGGRPVHLPKGTNVQVATWMRHRNKQLWGEDADVFNPDRDFRDSEVWGGEAFKAFNPSSPRFSPFMFSPRDCLGKNFAQMEIRTILANVFHHFTLELSEPYAKWNPSTDGPLENFGGTVGPRDLTIDTSDKRQRPRMAMYLRLKPRRVLAAAAKL